LFEELPYHLLAMALYKVNTGWREQEVCKLRWKWEIKVPDLETSVFLIPADFGGHFDDSGVKIGEECLVVLNDVARSILRRSAACTPNGSSLRGARATSDERHGLAKRKQTRG
jgi:hypothetical protein